MDFSTNHRSFIDFCDSSYSVEFSFNFRENIMIFLEKFALMERIKSRTYPNSKIWSTFLVDEGRKMVVPFYTIEEEVTDREGNSGCRGCICAGWANNFVSKRNYHFIIPWEDYWDLPPCLEFINQSNHLLHGMIHCGGSGHLFVLTGFGGGSNKLSGIEIMSLWDRICSCLRPSKISLHDTSEKHGMALRLVHTIAYGHSWFGKWNYTFLRGSFNTQQAEYDAAVKELSSLKIEHAIEELNQSDPEKAVEVKRVIDSYRNLGLNNLITMRDVLRFILGLKFKCTAKSDPCNTFPENNRDQMKLDLGCLMKNVILSRQAATTIQNCKSFLKEWPMEAKDLQSIFVLCQFSPSSMKEKSEIMRNGFVIEYPFIVPFASTVADLKRNMEIAMRDTYCILENVVITSIGYIGEDLEMHYRQLTHLVNNPGSRVWIKCDNYDVGTEYKFEAGIENWTVDCRRCGAQDDDGEGLFACDVCSIWRHEYCYSYDPSNPGQLVTCESCEENS